MLAHYTGTGTRNILVNLVATIDPSSVPGLSYFKAGGATGSFTLSVIYTYEAASTPVPEPAEGCMVLLFGALGVWRWQRSLALQEKSPFGPIYWILQAVLRSAR